MSIRLDKAVQNKVIADFGVELSRSYILKLLKMGAVVYNNEVIKRKGFKFPNAEEAEKIQLNKDMVQAVIKEYQTGVISQEYAHMWHKSSPIGHFNIRKELIDKIKIDKSDILYEDQDIVAMYKPAGIVSHPSSKDSEQDSMIYRFLKYMKQVYDFMPRAGLVHRLDRETQGILLFAKNMQAYNKLKEQFANNQVIKLYLGVYLIPKHAFARARQILVKLNDRNKYILELQAKDFFDNVLKLPEVQIKGFISMFKFKYKSAFVYHKKELKKRIFKQIKDAYSIEYPLFRINENIGISAIRIITGRTHQIRAQHEYLGLPLLNDWLYTAGAFKSQMQQIISDMNFSQNTIGLVAFGISFYKVSEPTKRVYITIPKEKLSLSFNF